MDMQMPIVDGLTSTKMIRMFEKSKSDILSPRASKHGRIPIFAVSASLVERELQTYIAAGFDGWILKPIDFKRLNTLLTGIVEDGTRTSCLYQPGEWERGGWFPDWKSSAPAGMASILRKPVLQTDDESLVSKTSRSSGESGSITPTIGSKNEPKKQFLIDERGAAGPKVDNDGGADHAK